MTTQRPFQVSGKAWLIKDKTGNWIDNIDTDMIFHNQHLHITEVPKMGPHAFGNLEGWEDFPERCGQGDILIVGKNFGAGSSRQQAVDCFRALGVSVIIAESFGAIYKRNAINSGMPILEAPGLTEWLKETEIAKAEAHFETGELTLDGTTHQIKPMSDIQGKIYAAGDLFAYGRQMA